MKNSQGNESYSVSIKSKNFKAHRMVLYYLMGFSTPTTKATA